MEIRQLRPGEVDRLVEACWLPYVEELAADDERCATVPGAGADQAEFYRSRVADDDAQFLVAIDDEDGTEDGEDSAEDDGEFVAFAVATLEVAPVFERGVVCSVADVYVAPAYRRRGIASELLTALETWGRERGAEEAHLHVGAANDAAIECYRERGYDVWRHQLAREL